MTKIETFYKLFLNEKGKGIKILDKGQFLFGDVLLF